MATAHNVPIQLTSFIGREYEIAEAKHLLMHTRLLTLTGIGGVGKTRLAFQVAREVSDDFVDGVWVVELAPLVNASLLPQAIAIILGIQEHMDIPLLTSIADALSEKKALFILDNCEHLIDACATLIEALLIAAPLLHIMATSREIINISTETTLLVSPLRLLNTADAITTEEALRYEAIRLFTERAKQANFVLTLKNMQAVAQVCQYLDGIPLALELAAARLRLMPIEQMAVRLEQTAGEGFHLLTNGSRTAPPRHQTLRGVIDWSYELLSVTEQLLLQRLSVFAGGWTLDAAEAVCVGEEIARPEVLHLLGQLVDKSLVLKNEESATEIAPKQARYTILEIIRQYSLEKQQKRTEDGRLQRQHVAYFLALAEEADTHLRSTEQLHWLYCLDKENDNLRVALGYTWQFHMDEEGLRLASALWFFWVMRARLSEGRKWLENMLIRNEKRKDVVQATALYRTSLMAWFQEDIQRFAELAEQSLTLFRQLDNRHGIGRALTSLAEATFQRGDYLQALKLINESLPLLEEVQDTWTQALVYMPLLTIKRQQGHITEALTLAETAFSLFSELGDRLGMALALTIRGRLARVQKDYDHAVSCYQQSMHLFRSVGFLPGIAIAMHDLGSTMIEQGNYEQARLFLEESRTKYQVSEDPLGVFKTVLDLAHMALEQGNSQQAALFFEESLQRSQQIKDKGKFAMSRYHLGQVAMKLHQHAQSTALFRESILLFYQQGYTLGIALCLESLVMAEVAYHGPFVDVQCMVYWLGLSQTLRQTLFVLVPGRMVDRQKYDETVAILQTALGEEKFSLALSHGQKMNIEQVITEVHKSPRLVKGRTISAPSTSPQITPSSKFGGLTTREVEILRLVAIGLSNASIAEQLCISKGTVKTHLNSIYGKLGVKSRTAATHCARQYNLLPS